MPRHAKQATTDENAEAGNSTREYERKMTHSSECVNSLHMHGDHLLVTAGDDGLVRLTDTRTWSALGSHRVRRVVWDTCCDDTRLFTACDDGTVRIFDYSRSAEATLHQRKEGGGFSEQQMQAFSAAVDAVRRREAQRDSS